MKSIYFALVFSFIFSINAESSQKIITLHYPPDMTIMEYGLLGISLSMPKGSADKIKVNTNNKEQPAIVPDSEFECFTVSLEPGVNSIEIVAVKGESLADKVTLNVFRRSDLISKYRNAPPDFKKAYFHMEERAQCTKCHALEPGVFDKKPVSPATFSAEAFETEAVIAATSTCYSCHKKLTTYPYVHGPASIWSCLSCHDSESFPRYSVKKPDSGVCYGCHVEKKNEWLAKKYKHGPVTMGKCTICHSPHASENPFNLFKSTWNLCVNCHFEKGTGRHVLGGSLFQEGHPTRDRKDPVRIGKELTCASCHNAHASDSPHLWAFNVQSALELCRKCHYDK